MKKIFTLIALAITAVGVQAQEIWKAADYDLSTAKLTTLTENIYTGGTADAPDTSKKGTLVSATITVSTTNVTLTAESTPNGDKTVNAPTDAWQLKGSTNGNDALIVTGCDPQFAQYLMGQGNAEVTHWEYDEETDNGTAHRVHGTYWQPGNDMPAKGNYLKFETKAAGTLKVAIYGNKNQNPTYIVDAETKQPIANSSINVSIFYQNTGFAYKGSVDTGDAEYLNTGTMPEDYVLQHVNGISQNRPVMGYVSFPVEAGKIYYMFNTQSQVGIYGFQFTGSAGISSTKTVASDDAPEYNLQGQKVVGGKKQIVIKNGKKYVK